MPLDLNVVLGVCGGVAAYKAVDLASRLTSEGARVRTILTANAQRLIGPRSFEAVTGQPVYTDLWADAQDPEHIRLSEWAGLVVVAPATANCIAKVASGVCDDLLTTFLCTCWQRPVIFAPAMNTRMWSNPVVQRNVRAVQDLGFRIVGPEHGRLACGEVGMGRMAGPERIAEAISELAAKTRGS